MGRGGLNRAVAENNPLLMLIVQAEMSAVPSGYVCGGHAGIQRGKVRFLQVFCEATLSLEKLMVGIKIIKGLFSFHAEPRCRHLLLFAAWTHRPRQSIHSIKLTTASDTAACPERKIADVVCFMPKTDDRTQSSGEVRFPTFSSHT